MGHHLSAIIGKTPINEEKRRDYQLAVAFEFGYAIVFLEMYSLAYWIGKLNMNAEAINEKLPDAYDLTFFFAKELGLDTYAMIQTDYFGGLGEQYAMVFKNAVPVSEVISINEALRKLGVVAVDGRDEFDTLNLGTYRDSDSYYWEYNNRAMGRRNIIPGRVPES